MQKFALVLASFLSISGAQAQEIGHVDTEWKLLGKNHAIVVSSHADPSVFGVTCYIARARTGGFKGTIGIAEDTSDASLSCHQTGPIKFAGTIPQQEPVFSEHRSIFFKYLWVVRMVDPDHNTLVYMTYSDKLLKGSPKSDITVIPVPRDQPIPVTKEVKRAR